ncbi:MAG: proton-conducting transporter membrane subunit [Lentimicrobium sp.]|jgi:multicomponent Na+:H+ antiporter subunit A|nr:proton-conducting transporter membrane subunit [Lentimicrobium sp.]
MSGLLNYLILLLAAAFFSPYLIRKNGKAAPWLLGLLSAGGFGYLLSYANFISAGNTLNYTIEWLPELYLNFTLYLDGLSLFFGLLVTGMGALVLVFAGKYMQPYPLKHRFFFLILLFEFAMLALILSGNLFTMFIFWELTSVSSFLLVGFNHEKPEARNAALQALLITVSGGLAMMAGFILLGQMTGTLEINQLLRSGDLIRNHPHYLPALLLILAGAFTKSAQFPFHFWLPGAMQAPSPVSAFLHSATMVKAGIYLIARLSPVMGGTPEWRYILTITGAITMLLGAYFAYSQTDFKKVLAYTTISALGTLVLMLGIDTDISVKAAIIFLLVHALYKGALFMVAGLIDKSAGSRDLRELGGLYKVMPFTALAAIVSLLSMAGLPPMIGFIGKELIYEAKFALPDIGNILLFVGVTTNVIMVAISLALIFNLFLGKLKYPGEKPKPPALALRIGPLILAAISLIFGLFPAEVARLLLKPAIVAIHPSIDNLKLALWHGFNEVLLVSFITVAAGVALFLLYRRINPLLTYFNKKAITFRFADAFNRGLDLFIKLTKKKTAFIQSGYQRYYLMSIFIMTAGLTWYQLVYTWQGWGSFVMPGIVEIILLVVLALATLYAVLVRSRLAAILSLGAVGYSISLLFIIYGAIDLAITMMLAETLVLVLFMAIVYHLPKFTNFSSGASRLRDAIIALLVGGVMTGLVLKSVQLDLSPKISDFYNENALALAYGKNVVNVILVDFRALDTLGEITVLAIAAIGVAALLKLKTKKGSAT